ncbi:calcium-binding protein [Ralstonia sp. 1138]|uniref:calcium-binding protein n=1 Tax=Ralstonia sp. 1138 TaxID=3156423 RepID=UPI0033967B79
MPFVTVNIANAGTPLSDGNTSSVGHMWYSLDKGDGSQPSSYGFAPDENHHGQPFAPGQVYSNDNSNYTSTYYTRTVEISQAQYDAMKNFGEATRIGMPDSTVHVNDINGKGESFTLHYNGLTNSCIDYTWKAMEVGGLNPSDFQGAVWPTWNKSFVDDMLNKYENGIGSRDSIYNSDKQMQNWLNLGEIGSQTWQSYTAWSTSQLVNAGGISYIDNGSQCLPYAPIGAFYESKSAATDNATSIANKTFRVLNSSNQGLTAVQLAALDANHDGKLGGIELNGLNAWTDANEDGLAQTSELTELTTELANAGLSSVRSTDYAFYTSGNANFKMAGQENLLAPANSLAAPGVPAALESNYRTLRDNDNRFYVNANQWIDWAPDQIKLSSNQQNLVGTDGSDTFDISYYAQYDGSYFNLSLVRYFYAGAGDDLMGGSVRNDTLWGGTGNDTLLGYDGDDQLYGEEGSDQLQGGNGNDLLNGGADNDVLLGQEGNDTLIGDAGNDELQGGNGSDTLDGGAGDDMLFGQVGDDVMNGGDGNDVMMGFTASNEAKQTLAAGETDNDAMFGGAGTDQMYGGLGDDYIDGGADNDLVAGGDGDDRLYGGAGDDEVNGGTGNEIMDGGIGADRMFGGVGNDQMWGGDGNDIMMGFTPSNDTKQTLAAGETDDDLMYGGAGDDLMLGGLGNDQVWGGVGNDEIQGGDGNDQLYGEDGNDRLFGSAGDDTIYGGNGDDLIVGGVATNEAALAAGVSDNNLLYGGAGNDTIIGGVGNDYIDGGAGADNMQGGKGDDIYIVNSVNDVILEQAGEGYDTVIASTNYILNANVQELRLTEGGAYNGTGNSLNNRIIGNNQDNILDGVTGADTMIGAQGDDTYYVDNVGDQVIELAGEGTDTAAASISYTLGANVEDLTLLDFSKAEKGIADEVPILVYGYPKAYELDYMQGNAVAGYKGTCALTSIANLATQANQALSESQVVQTAIDNNWCVTDPTKADYQRGGSNYVQQQALLSSYGINSGIIMGYNEQAIANLIKGGRGVIIGLNAGKLWDDANYLDNGGVNHVVTVTGVACDAATGAINGFYIADSGRGLVSDMTRYVSSADFRNDADVANAYSIYTVDPIKLWEENIDATGNELANTITGNRGDNVLAGGLGNDTVIGQAGNDTYKFAHGDGQDTVIDSDATAGNIDVIQFSGINQNNLWFKHVGDDLQISVMGTTDQIIVKDWYVGGASGTDNHIERIRTADGLTMYDTDVEQFVQAMDAFAPPPATQTSWANGQTSNGQVLMTVTH